MGDKAVGQRFRVYPRVELHISLYGMPEWMQGGRASWEAAATTLRRSGFTPTINDYPL